MARSSGSATLIRADVFVFGVSCLNDWVSIAILVLGIGKARCAAAAVTQLMRCEAGLRALTLHPGRRWARWVGAQVLLVTLAILAVLLACGLIYFIDDEHGPSYPVTNLKTTYDSIVTQPKTYRIFLCFIYCSFI